MAAIKRRRFTKGLILIGAEGAHLEPFVRSDWMDWVERHLVRNAYGLSDPPVTWLLPARARSSRPR